MIHVLNHNSEIIDFISRSDNVIIHSEYKREKENNSELLDLTILSSRAKHFKENNRIIIQDKSNQYREFIIHHIEDSGQYIDVEATASYVVDIGTAKPIPAGKYEKMSVTQKLDEVLRDTDWVTGDCDYGGVRTNSWTSVRTPYEMISQLETSHELESDFEIIIEGNEVVERRVNMKKPNSLFKGKEIEYGKDLTEMKRTVDFSKVVTALFAFGPEDDKGNRISLVVTDDEAQEQFGLPTRYIWGIYEPESDDENMTADRLKTLARTELNKRKSATVSYEISTFDIEKQFPHEVIRFGDTVRIKNSDFVPSLYAESEVIGFTHDLISDDIVYTFGNVVEYAEDDLLKYFKGKLNEINQKLNDNITNINTIVNDAVAGELEYYERKIFKGTEPPENPQNDTLWLDTSNPKVAVLRRYFNGEWHNATAEKASDVGAVTREQAMYSELTNAFINLNIQHSKLLKEVTQVVNSEYFVSKTLKADVQAKLNETIGVFNKIKSNLDSMTSETATIGKLVDTQAFFLDYREKLQALYTSVETAKRAIDARFKLLQSQYTDKKFNDAMNKVASVIPGGRWDASSQTLTSDIPDESRISEITSALMNSAIEGVAQSIAETNQRIYDNTQSLNERLDSKAQELLSNVETSAQNLRQYVDTQKISLKDEVDNQFKLTTSEFSNAIKATKESIVNDVTKPLSIRLNTAESGLQQLQDSLLLTATKTEVNRMLTDQLTPLKTEVNKQQAQLKVMTDSINSKVNKSDYTTDKNGIVERLNNADSERQQLSDEINDRVTLEEYKNTQLGTRNLLVGSDDLSGFKGTVTKIEKDGHTFGLLKKPDFSQVWMSQNVKVEPNTDYTLSFYAFKNGTDKAGVYTAVRLLKDDGTDFSPIKALFTASQFVTDRVERYSKTFRVEDYTWIRVYFTSIDGSNATLPYISRPQLEKSKWMSDYKKAEEDVETSLTKLETKVSQNGREINAKASTEELNASKKTLSRVLADLTLNTTTGITLKYDENGNIQSHTIGPDGVKINASKIEINEGDVVIQNGVTTIKDAYIDKLFSKNATIQYLNSIDITAKRLRASDDKAKVDIENGSITMTRADKAKLNLGINGISMYNSNGSKRFSIDERLVTSSAIGTSNANVYLGTGGNYEARVVDVSGLPSDGYVDSYRYRPLRAEGLYGNFWNINTADTLGDPINLYARPLSGGELRVTLNESTSNYQNLRVDGIFANFINVNGLEGNSRNLYLMPLSNGEVRSTISGQVNNYAPIRAQSFYLEGGQIADNSSGNSYIGTNGEWRFTSNQFYNGGDTKYRDIRFGNWHAMSSEKFKYDIKEWNYSVLDAFRNDLKLYSYKINAEKETKYARNHHGIIIEREIPIEWRHGDGFDGNEVIFWNTKAIQELIEKVDKQNKQIQKLEERLNEQSITS